jgi:hypothetical protein
VYRYGPCHEDPEPSRGGGARGRLAAGRLRRGGRRGPDAGGLGGLGGHGGVRVGDPRELAVAVYFDWRADAGDFLTLLKPPGSTPETTRTFVEMLRVTRDCVS